MSRTDEPFDGSISVRTMSDEERKLYEQYTGYVKQRDADDFMAKQHIRKKVSLGVVARQKKKGVGK